MKKYLLFIGFMILCSFFTKTSYAQQKVHTAKWASDKGYWVIENNINKPKDHVISFYNNDDVLLYKEQLTGVKLNLSKTQVKMKLKKVLEATITAWEQKRVPEENKQYVAAVL